MSIKILVVDDNKDILNAYVKALKHKVKVKQWNSNPPYGSVSTLSPLVESADTVSMALSKMKVNHYSILVVDLRIPSSSSEDDMGGLDLISESKKLDPLRPIIVVTAYGTVSAARKALTQGSFDVIEKSSRAVDKLVEAVQKAVDSHDEKIRRVGNPFTKTGKEPTFFGGRENELKFFEEKLHRAIYQGDCEHFLILGKSGIGKSTLLREYKKICQNRGYIASIVTLEFLQVGTSLQEAAQSIISGIFRDLPCQVSKFTRVLKLLQELNVSFSIPGGSAIKLAWKNAKPETDNVSPQDLLCRTLTQLWKDLEDKTKVLVILLDDLEQFMNVSEILITLKSALSQDSMKNCKIVVGLAIAPSNWSQFTSIQTNNSLSKFFASQVKLQMLAENDLYQTVQTSLLGTGVSFTPEIIEKIYEYTEGNPFRMQILCHELFKNQLSQHVDGNIWDKALEDTIKYIYEVIEQIVDQITAEETQVLKFIANLEHPLSIEEIKTRLELNSIFISLDVFEKYLQSLVKKQLVNMTGNILYHVQDKMFRIYILNYLE